MRKGQVLNTVQKMEIVDGKAKYTTTQEFTNTRGHGVLSEITFMKPVKCALDGYLKDSCLHRRAVVDGSKCAECIACNLCQMKLINWYGSEFKYTKSPVNAEHRAEKREKYRLKRARREQMRQEQRQKRYAKRGKK